jgi:hypothetical protein
MGGAIVILVAMFIVGPIGLFVTGALWSAVNGELQSVAADTRAQTPEAPG